MGVCLCTGNSLNRHQGICSSICALWAVHSLSNRPGLFHSLVHAAVASAPLAHPRPSAAKPAGQLYLSAHDLLRKLQRQQQERGWRCAAAPASPGSEPAGLDAAAGGGDAGSGAGPRRFLTSAERVRQKLAGAGAKTHKEWAMLKQQEEARQRQLIKVS